MGSWLELRIEFPNHPIVYVLLNIYKLYMEDIEVYIAIVIRSWNDHDVMSFCHPGLLQGSMLCASSSRKKQGSLEARCCQNDQILRILMSFLLQAQSMLAAQQGVHIEID